MFIGREIRGECVFHTERETALAIVRRSRWIAVPKFGIYREHVFVAEIREHAMLVGIDAHFLGNLTDCGFSPRLIQVLRAGNRLPETKRRCPFNE